MNEPETLAFKVFGFILRLMFDATHEDSLVNKGEHLYLRQCSSCHAMPSEDKNALGPSLHGVVGRHAGIAQNYNYSSAIHDTSITWTEEHLDGYLTSSLKYVGPVAYAPHRYLDITFSGFDDDADRKAVIAFLKAN